MIELKQPAIALAVFLASTACQLAAAQSTQAAVPSAADDPRDIGFSFFLGVGAQTASYRETSSLLPVRSKATSTSPLIVSGALYAINRDVLFSVSNLTTFAPGSTTETWTATSSELGGIALTNPVVQRNGFSLTQNSTQLLGYYRLADKWFAVAGPSLHSQTFKRYSFVQGVDQAVTLPSDRSIEESTNEILANVGVALESGKVHGQDSHYGASVMLGLPIWSRTDNTEWPDTRFRSTSGYDLAFEGRASWAVFKDIHAGLWGQWLMSERSKSTHDTLELPRNRLQTFSYGLELLWKL